MFRIGVVQYTTQRIRMTKNSLLEENIGSELETSCSPLYFPFSKGAKQTSHIWE